MRYAVAIKDKVGPRTVRNLPADSSDDSAPDPTAAKENRMPPKDQLAEALGAISAELLKLQHLHEQQLKAFTKRLDTLSERLDGYADDISTLVEALGQALDPVVQGHEALARELSKEREDRQYALEHLTRRLDEHERRPC